MHKILVLNGSPKNEKSLTMRLVESFLSGVSDISIDVNIENINLYEKDIKPCAGGFECWTITPGKCAKEDDMNTLLEKYIEADIIIWATPLYHYGITSVMKKFLERTLPIFLPFIDPEGGGIFGHPYRNTVKMEDKKHVLISTCAFPSVKNNYEGVEKQFDNLFGQGKWEKIFCVEGELLGLSQLDNFTGPYLELMKVAGREYITELSISDSLKEGLAKPFVDIPAFLDMSNLSWGVDDLRVDESDGGLIAWSFMKHMRAAFNPSVRPGLNAVLQIDFNDLKESYQLVIKDNECTLFRNDFTMETTRINTHFTNWERIIEGKIDLAEALMEKKYTVEGNFNLINALVDGLFGNLALHTEKNKKLIPVVFKNTPYWFILTMIPWMACFILANFNPFLGVIVPLLISGILFAIKKGSDLVYFDKTTMLFFSLLTLVTVPWSIGYDAFTIAFSGFIGLFVIWLASAFKTVPLTADYTHFFNGRNALKNILFLKTNRIVTVVWAFLFLIQGLMALWIATTSMVDFAAVIPQILLIPGFIFTGWFGKWYPSYVAKPE